MDRRVAAVLILRLSLASPQTFSCSAPPIRRSGAPSESGRFMAAQASRSMAGSASPWSAATAEVIDPLLSCGHDAGWLVVAKFAMLSLDWWRAVSAVRRELRVLRLSGHRISTPVAVAGVRHCPNLLRLDVSDSNNVKVTAVITTLCEWARSSGRPISIRKLVLDGCDMPIYCHETVRDAFSMLTTLEELVLTHCIYERRCVMR